MKELTQKEEQLANETKFDTMLSTLDPALWKIHRTLKETGINPLIVPAVINALYEVAYVTGFGNITIFVSDGKVTDIEPKPRMKLNIEAILKEITEF